MLHDDDDAMKEQSIFEESTRPSGEAAPVPVHVTGTREEAELAVATEIVDLLRSTADAGRGCVLGLATGGSMVGVYRELVRLYREGHVSFAHATTINLDEYVGLAPEDPRSFAAFMRVQLFDHVDLPAERAIVPDGEAARVDPAGYARALEATIESAGGIDLQLLGLGRNGHIAFNEPGSSLASRTRLVDLDPMTREDAAAAFDGAPPKRAITLGVATILEARRLRVLAFGERKAEIVHSTLFAPEEPDLPATFLRRHPDLALWLDRAAATRLDGYGEHAD